MCSYKLVTVKFEVWGLQTRVEQFVHKVSETGAVSYPSHKQDSSTHKNVAVAVEKPGSSAQSAQTSHKVWKSWSRAQDFTLGTNVTKPGAAQA